MEGRLTSGNRSTIKKREKVTIVTLRPLNEGGPKKGQLRRSTEEKKTMGSPLSGMKAGYHRGNVLCPSSPHLASILILIRK